jgi:hypothetical protein
MNPEEKQKFLKESKKILKATSKLIENKFKGTQSSDEVPPGRKSPKVYGDFTINDAIQIITQIRNKQGNPKAIEKILYNIMDFSVNGNGKVEAQLLRTELVNTITEFNANYSYAISKLTEYIKSEESSRDLDSPVTKTDKRRFKIPSGPSK